MSHVAPEGVGSSHTAAHADRDPREVPAVEIADLHHVFPGRSGGAEVKALDGLDITVEPNSFVSIVGPSGCGKSTLFNIIGGLVSPTAGRVSVQGVDVRGHTPSVAYMMQSDLLLPWRTIMKNVVLGAEIRGFPGEVTRERARSLVTRFGLAGYEDAYPSELSGGMRQRAALLRTLLCETDIILLDEPFASLDALSRVVMQEWLLGIREEFRRTMILITHDVDEALFLSNKVYVLSARPASVKDVVQVTLPRPRTHLVMETPEFVKLRAALLEPLWEEGAKSLNTELSAVRPGMVSTENV